MKRYERLNKYHDYSQDDLIQIYANAMVNYHYFLENILCYEDMNEEHFKLANFLQRRRRNFRIILNPRYTFKSCVITQGYALWKLVNDPNYRVLIYSDNATKAQGFLRGIKNHIIGGGKSNFKEFYTGWQTDPHKGTWNESQIIVSKRTERHVEPSIDTAGIETSKVGMHYDLIMFDDIVSKVNVTTKEQMDKVHDCYRESLSLLKPDGEVIITGTRWHFNDAYGRLIAENTDTDRFDVFVTNADDRNKRGQLIYEDIGLTEKFLGQQRKEQGSYIYSCLYRNSPVDSDASIFKKDDFRYYGSLESAEDTRHGIYPNLYVTLTLDPAGQGEDRWGGVVLGTDDQAKMHVLDLWHQEHGTPSQSIDWIMRMNNKYNVRMVGIEKTFYRGMLEKELKKRRSEEQKSNPHFNSFGVKGFDTRWSKGEGKKVRIKDLQPFVERGDLLFPGKQFERLRGAFSDLAYQMMTFTDTHMPEPNDLLDALAWQPELIQKGRGKVEQSGPPKNSPAELEQRWMNQANQMQRRLPRFARREWQPSLS